MLKEKIIKITSAAFMIILLSVCETDIIYILLKKHYGITLNWSLDILLLMTIFMLVNALIYVQASSHFQKKQNTYALTILLFILTFIIIFLENVKFVNNHLYFEWSIFIKAFIKPLLLICLIYFFKSRDKKAQENDEN